MILSETQWDILSRIDKEDFVKKYKPTVIEWLQNNQNKIIEFFDKKKCSGNGSSFQLPIEKRDMFEKAIGASRTQNNGAVDLNTLDQICYWGFHRNFPVRDEELAKKITKEAFQYLDKGNFFEAVYKIMTEIHRVSISRASKIIGLSNQNDLCIYDSRVGYALEDLKKDGVKLVRCPPSRGYKTNKSNTYKIWARNYERLIWIIEIMKDYFKAKNLNLRAADIEMALCFIV